MFNKSRITHNRILLAPPSSANTDLDAPVAAPRSACREDSILILDDDDYFRNLVSSLLAGRGYEVLEARNAEQATECLGKHNPSAAIVDYRLPGMDGISWITSIREQGNTMPIIFVSGVWCDKRTFEWLRNILKVSLIIKKPIEPELFLSSIESIVPSKTVDSAARNSAQAPEVDVDELLSRPDLEESLHEIDRLLESETLSEPDRANLTKVRRVVMTHRAVNIAKKAYISDLPNEWRSLAELLSQLRDNQGNNTLLSEALSLAHKIKGSSGSYGLGAISEKAEQIESILSAVSNSLIPVTMNWNMVLKFAEEGEWAIHEALTQQEQSNPKRAMSILLISPETRLFEQLSNFSNEFDLSVEHVASARDAVDLCRLKSFDAAVIDLYGHGSPNYLHLAKRLRSIPKCAFLPLGIVLQQAVDMEDSELIYQGFSAVISNPISKDGLGSVLEKLKYDSESQNPRVLCIDDDKNITSYLCSILEDQGYTTLALNEPILTPDVMQQFRPDVVLLDLIMPGLSGYDVCRLIRSRKEFENTKVVVLTQRGDAESRSGAFRAGASDFLVKPIVAAELIVRLKAQVAIAQNSADTKIYEKNAFCMHAKTLLERCLCERVKLSMVVVKTEHPAKIDATHGDFSSDEVIDAFRKVLSTRLRPCDLRGNWSEHEFVILLPGVERSEAEKVAHHLRWEVGQYQFPSEQGSSFCMETWSTVIDCEELALPLEDSIEAALSSITKETGVICRS